MVATRAWSCAGLVVVAASCGSDPEPADDQPPQIAGLTLRENPNNHLSYYLEFNTSEAAHVAVTVRDETGREYPVRVPSEPQSEFELHVLGLRAEHDYQVNVTASDAAGNRSDQSTQTSTGPLPADFPPVELTTRDASRATSGYTLFNVFRINSGLDPSFGLALAVDEAGEVVWYHRAPTPITYITQLPDGGYGVMAGDGLAEVDAMGNTGTQFAAPEFGLDTIHHDFQLLPDGNIVTLSTELQRISGYPPLTPGGPDETYDVVGDVVAEISRDRRLVSSVSLFDLLDPMQITPNFHTGFYDGLYPSAAMGTKDWTHTNAVLYDSRDDTLLLSVRHLNSIVKLNRQTGQIVWRFGEGYFRLAPGAEFTYHAHAPAFSSSGTLLVYDNGNFRSTVPSGQAFFTRVVEFRIKDSGPPDQWVAEQLWEYRGESSYFAPFLGSVQELGNGNILICDGGRVSDWEKGPLDPANLRLPRIVEVTHETPAQVVMELKIGDSVKDDPSADYAVYRAHRINDLELTAP